MKNILNRARRIRSIHAFSFLMACAFIELSHAARPVAFPSDIPGKLVFHSYSNYEAWDGKLFLFDFVSKQTQEISRNWNIRHPINAHFSPDGRKLVFMGANAGSTDWDIFLFDLASGAQPLNLTQRYGMRDEDPKFSPDGTTIVFKQNGDLKVMNLAGELLRSLTNDGYAVEESMPFFSADGSGVYCAAGVGLNSDIYRIELQSSEITKIAYLSGIQEYYPIASETGLFYTAWESATSFRDRIFFIPTGGQTKPLPFKAPDGNHSDPYPIGPNYVVFSGSGKGSKGGYDLYLGDVRTGKTWSMSLFGVNGAKHELGASYSRY